MSAEPCPDPEALAAWAAGALDDAARAPIVRHVEACASCREAVAILAQMEPSGGGPPDEAAREVGPAPLPGPGDRFGPFSIERVLGRGGMGVVLLARDERLDREVALKLASTGDEGAGARLRREAKALAALRHPNLVAVHEVGEEGGRAFLAMELVRGQTLRAWVAAERPPWSAVLARCLDAARGLEALHDAGFLHRDIKPDNLMLSEDGRVIVVDLGLAQRPDAERAPESARTRTGAIVGTPRYLAPERVAGAPAGVSSDVYALAATTLELVRAAPAPPPARVVATLTRALDPDPRERPASIAALREALARELRPRWPGWAAGAAVLALGALAARLATAGGGDIASEPQASAAAPPVGDAARAPASAAPLDAPRRASVPGPATAEPSATAESSALGTSTASAARASAAPDVPPPSPAPTPVSADVAPSAPPPALASATPLVSGSAAPQLLALASSRPDLVQVDPRPLPPPFTREWFSRMDWPPISFEAGYAKIVEDYSDCEGKPAAELMPRALDWGKVEKASVVELTDDKGKTRPSYLVLVKGQRDRELFHGFRDGSFLDVKPGDWVLVKRGGVSHDVVPTGFEAASAIRFSAFAPIGGPPAWASKKPRPSYLPCGARLRNPTDDPRSDQREWPFGEGAFLFALKKAPERKLGKEPQFVDGVLLEAAPVLSGAEHLEKASRKRPIWVIARFSRIESYKDTKLAVMHVEEVLPSLAPPPK